MKINALSMPSWLKIATWLLLASLATLGFKNPVLIWVFNFNDIFLMASFACLVMAIRTKEVSVKIPRKAISFFAIVIGSIVLGSILSVTVFHIFPPIFFREYARLVACLAILFEIYVIGLHDRSFSRNALYAIVIPSVFLPLMIYAPAHILSFILDESQTRFAGFLVDPNYFASFQILPSFILLWISFAQPFGKKLWLSAISLVLFSFSVGSILWSGSRGGVFGLGLGLVALIGFFIWKLPSRKWILLTALTAVACLASFALLPAVGKGDVLYRGQNIVDHATTQPLLRFTADQGRSEIWRHAIPAIAANPLGYGLGYHQVANIVGAGEDNRVVHDTPLELILTGGIVLFFVIGMGAYAITKKALSRRLVLSGFHYVFCALIAIAAAGLFIDSFTTRWIWVMLGLIFILLPSE